MLKPHVYSAVRWLRRVLTVFGALTVLIIATPITGWWAIGLSGNAFALPPGDVLIVLGGDGLGGGLPRQDTYWRCVYAGRAWHSGSIKRILVVGAAGPLPPQASENGGLGSLAGAMRRLLILEGCPAAVIEAETTSRTTRENALASARLLDSVKTAPVLLTSDYHMFRAKRVFRKVGISVRPYSIPDALKRSQHWSQRLAVFVELCEESSKIVYYFIRGWV